MKKVAAILATAGVLAVASVPAMATASTVQNHETTLNSASSVSVNSISPEGTYSNAWGTSMLTSDPSNMKLIWQLSPADPSKTYTYNLGIEYYTSGGTSSSYVGTIAVPSASGAGTLTGSVSYPRYLPLGLYYAKLIGSWTASDGTSGTIGNYLGAASTSFLIND